MIAPASSAAPCQTGRHKAAATTTATSVTITATSPAITGAGFAKALPAVHGLRHPGRKVQGVAVPGGSERDRGAEPCERQDQEGIAR